MIDKFYLFLLIVLISITSLYGIPIPNGQLGEAEVECGENEIEIAFITEDIFRGRIYVVGHANDTNCVSREVGSRSTSITIRKNNCGIATIRSKDPPGLFVNVKIIISFHDEFITKVDRGYEISCFFMETDKTVTYPISVSPNTLLPLTEFGDMPRCRYELADAVTHKPVSIVSVGTKLLHKWVCDTTTPNLWCMTVHSCFVEDNSGSEFVILNDQGCAVDRFLLNNLEYGPEPLTAKKEANAFKYADNVIMNFQCSIRLDIRDGECPIPKCTNVSGQRPRTAKRSTSTLNRTQLIQDSIYQGFTELNVHAPKLDVLDPPIGFGPEKSRDFKVKLRPISQQCVLVEALIVPTSLAVALIVSLTSVIIYLTLFAAKQ